MEAAVLTYLAPLSIAGAQAVSCCSSSSTLQGDRGSLRASFGNSGNRSNHALGNLSSQRNKRSRLTTLRAEVVNPPQGAISSPFKEEDGEKEKMSGLYSADVYDELTVEKVDLVLNEVRPYLISDGGNVVVASVDDGVVSLRLQGACGSCPSSTTTMKMGIERVLKEKFGASLKGVVQVDQQQTGATVMGVDSHLEMLRAAIHNYGGFVQVVSVSPDKGLAVIKYKGPAPIAMGIKAAIKDAFPDINEVVLVDEHQS